MKTIGTDRHINITHPPPAPNTKTPKSTIDYENTIAFHIMRFEFVYTYERLTIHRRNEPISQSTCTTDSTICIIRGSINIRTSHFSFTAFSIVWFVRAQFSHTIFDRWALAINEAEPRRTINTIENCIGDNGYWFDWNRSSLIISITRCKTIW